MVARNVFRLAGVGCLHSSARKGRHMASEDELRDPQEQTDQQFWRTVNSAKLFRNYM